jgi:hypothetical protein
MRCPILFALLIISVPANSWAQGGMVCKQSVNGNAPRWVPVNAQAASDNHWARQDASGARIAIVPDVPDTRNLRPGALRRAYYYTTETEARYTNNTADRLDTVVFVNSPPQLCGALR